MRLIVFLVILFASCANVYAVGYIDGKVTQVTGNSTPSDGSKKKQTTRPSPNVVVYAVISHLVPDEEWLTIYQTKRIIVHANGYAITGPDGRFRISVSKGKYVLIAVLGPYVHITHGKEIAVSDEKVSEEYLQFDKTTH